MSLSRGLRDLRERLGLRPLSARSDRRSGPPDKDTGQAPDRTAGQVRTGDRSELAGQADRRTGQPEVTGQGSGQLTGPDRRTGADSGPPVRLLSDVLRTVRPGGGHGFGPDRA